jgi:ribosomal protein S18 acetylase RimI-like enzyme
MAVQQLDGVEQALEGCPLVLRKIEPSEAELHWRIGAEVFGVPDEVMQRVAGPAVLSLPAVSCYVGELDGVGVATSMACLVDGHLAIFNVGTSAQQRRRGYGAAVTAIAIRDGFAAGAHTAWLQSAPMGLGVYERMGFALVESWRCWMRTSGAD